MRALGNAREDRIACGDGIATRDPIPHDTIADPIEPHLADMADVGRSARRSKAYTLTRERVRDKERSTRVPPRLDRAS